MQFGNLDFMKGQTPFENDVPTYIRFMTHIKFNPIR